MTTCLNCGNTFKGKFCNNCGQKASTGRLDLHHTTHDFQHSLFHLDKGIFYNFRTVTKPRLILDYIKGKRVDFFSPILYVLLISGLLAYLETHFYIYDTQGTKPTHNDQLFNTAFYLGKLIRNYAKYMEVSLILPFAFLATAFFKRSHRFNFTENLYIFAFIIANANLFAIATYPATRLLSTFFADKLISVPIILFYTCAVYGKGNYLLTFLKSLLLLIAAYLLTIAVFLLVAFLILTLKQTIAT